MNTKLFRVIVLLALLGGAFFGAARPAHALGIIRPTWCNNPFYAMLEDILNIPNPPYYSGYIYNLYCNPASGVADDPALTRPASMKLYDGFALAVIDGIPGVAFKAFLYQHYPQPQFVPEGWHIFGYGVDIFYDNGNVNPDGRICFQLPEGVLGNFEVGVFSYDGQDFSRLSSTNCAGFTGGGSFFLLTKVDPAMIFGGEVGID